MDKSIFPEKMMKATEMSIETIAGKLTYFHEQLHILHWNTSSYAEHMALGGLYDYVHDFKDGVVEKLMGYSGRKVSSLSIPPISSSITALSVVVELMNFASQLKQFGESNGYHDICNLADSLSGEAAKTKYLLTLS